MMDNHSDLLLSGIKELGLIAQDTKIQHLIAYMHLLQKWNKVFSLTAITDAIHIINYHLLDGLTTVPFIEDGKSILDVGSGMGVPGIILAIWYPNSRVVLIDSNKKKCAFLQQVVIELGLTNVEIVLKRVESYSVSNKFDVIISRAFASARLFVDLAKHLVADDGYFLAMKGKPEVNEIIANLEQIKVKIPGISDNRVLLKISF